MRRQDDTRRIGACPIPILQLEPMVTVSVRYMYKPALTSAVEMSKLELAELYLVFLFRSTKR